MPGRGKETLSFSARTKFAFHPRLCDGRRKKKNHYTSLHDIIILISYANITSRTIGRYAYIIKIITILRRRIIIIIIVVVVLSSCGIRRVEMESAQPVVRPPSGYRH